MTTPEHHPFGDARQSGRDDESGDPAEAAEAEAAEAAEADVADVADQRRPIDDADAEGWSNAAHIAGDRHGEASEADLIEQAIIVPLDDSEFDR